MPTDVMPDGTRQCRGALDDLSRIRESYDHHDTVLIAETASCTLQHTTAVTAAHAVGVVTATERDGALPFLN